MGEIILHHKGAYNFYSTTTDSPVFESALTREQVEGYIREEYGSSALKNLPARIERAQMTGTSGRLSNCLQDEISNNQAGNNGSKMSFAKFVERYLTLPCPDATAGQEEDAGHSPR